MLRFEACNGKKLEGARPQSTYDKLSIVDIRLIRSIQEFRHIYTIRWLFLPGKPRVKGDNNGHGTCVASKVAGPPFGVAKSANIVVMKADPVGRLLVSSAIAALGMLSLSDQSRNLKLRFNPVLFLPT